MQGSDTRNAHAATAATGLALIGLASVVAIASRAPGSTRSGQIRGGAGLHIAGTAVLAAGLVVWLAATAVLVLALWPSSLRRPKRSPEHELFDPYRPEMAWWEKALAFALPVLVLAAVAAAIVVFRGNGASRPHSPARPFGTAITSAPPTQGASRGTVPTGRGGPSVTAPLVIAAAVVAAAAAALALGRRRRGRVAGAHPRPQSRALADALDRSLDDLRHEPDPRRAVIAAYARMELLLGEHGARRHAWETPLEYLRRARDRVPLRDDSADTLTGLFQEARFSPHEVGEEHRRRAVAVLTSIRRELSG